MVAISGLFVSWHRLAELSYCETVVLLVFMYITVSCVFLSIAEMSSVLPFTTGAAGFTRVSLGNFWGFAIGIAEFIQGVFFICISLYDFSSIIYDACGFQDQYIKIAIFAITLLVMFLIKLINFRFAYSFSYFCGILVTILWVIHIISDLIRIKDYTKVYLAGANSAEFILRRVKDPLWFFFNLSVLPVHCRHTENPKQNVPKIMLSTLLFIFLISFITITLYYLNNHIASYHPIIVLAGPLIETFYPDATNNEANYILLIFLLPLFFNMFTFYLSQSLSFSALAESGFIPSIFCLDPQTGMPTWKVEFFEIVLYFGIVCCSFIGHKYHDIILLVLSCGTFFIYCLEMVSCYSFLHKFSSLKRGFRSPLGKYSPGFGFFLTLFLFLVTFIFDPLRDFVIYTFISYFFVIAVVYNFYARHNQKFSEIEQKTLFAAYVINANASKHKKQKLSKLDKEKKEFELKVQNFFKKVTDFLSFLANPWQEKHQFAEGMEVDSSILDHVSSIPGSSSKSNSHSDENNNLNESISEDSTITNPHNHSRRHSRKNSHSSHKHQPKLSFLRRFIYLFSSYSKISPTESTTFNSHALQSIQEGDIESRGHNREQFTSQETPAEVPAIQTLYEVPRELISAEILTVVPVNPENSSISKNAENTLNREAVYLV